MKLRATYRYNTATQISVKGSHNMAKSSPKKKKKPAGPPIADSADRHVLYQMAVQAPEPEVEFFSKTYQTLRGHDALSMKEDFCGTAYLSVAWVESDPRRTAIGVDIDKETLWWGTQHNIDPAGDKVASRITLFDMDVRAVTEPKVDITCAMNFSYSIFKTRADLRGYFAKVREGLNPEGLFIMDLFGGTECYDTLEEETELRDGKTTYIWEHAKFNPISNEILCHIHFEFPDGSRMEKAFTYDWRLWSIQEMRELLEEAGFSKVRIYWERYEEGDDDDDEYMEGTGEYYEVTDVENQESWMCYIVAER